MGDEQIESTIESLVGFGPDNPLELSAGIQLRFFELPNSSVVDRDGAPWAVMSETIQAEMKFEKVEDAARMIKLAAQSVFNRSNHPQNITFVVLFNNGRFGVWVNAKTVSAIAEEMVVGIVEDYLQQKQAGVFGETSL